MYIPTAAAVFSRIHYYYYYYYIVLRQREWRNEGTKMCVKYLDKVTGNKSFYSHNIITIRRQRRFTSALYVVSKRR